MCLLICVSIIRKKNKEIKMYKKIASDILSQFDNINLARIIKYCKEYITYSIDTKEINRTNKIKDNQKEVSALLELCEKQYIVNNCKLEAKATKNANENIKSTLTENEEDVSAKNKKEIEKNVV